MPEPTPEPIEALVADDVAHQLPFSLTKPFFAEAISISSRLKGIAELDFSVTEGLLRLGASALAEGKEHFTIGAKVRSPEGARKPFTLQILTVLIEKVGQGYLLR